MPPPYSIMLARFPGNQSEHPDSSGYIAGLMEELLRDPRVGAIHPWRCSDTPITMVRNRCAKAALDLKAQYLLMIDSDMQPDCEPGAPTFWQTAWSFMMERRDREWNQMCDERTTPESIWKQFAPATIAAPYCGPPPSESVYVFRWLSADQGAPELNFRIKMIDRDDAARRKGIEEVPALPTGLILYDMRVFRKLPPPWFEYEWTDGYKTEKSSTEDVYQTRNASMMGMPQFCTWDCWAGHNKLKLVTKPKPITMQTMRAEFADAILRSAGK